MTSADVKEIQDRNAAARGRVIEATTALGVTVDPALIQAAMMELAAIWREEAAHVTAAGRKGHIGIAKEYTQAAARLAGFAVGLTTRPITPPEPDGADPDMMAIQSWDAHENAAAIDALREACSHPAASLSTLASGAVKCTACGATLQMAMDADPTEWLAAALPEGDPVAAVFSSPITETKPLNLCTKQGGCPKHPDMRGIHHDFPLEPPTIDGIASDQSEEQNLRDIIGPLGASTVTATIDHPFTNPGIPWLNQRRSVEVIPYAELPIIAAATPPRGHVSHSYVETYEGCSLSAMLRDASRAGHVGASRPSWSQLGGQAFHRAVEILERMALSGVVIADDPEALWNQHFDAVIKEQLDALVGTPYADSATWYISNRGKEGFDWWRVEGAKMLGLYVKHHTPTWRANNPTFLLQDTTPVIELEYSMSIRSLDGERGLTAQGFVDRATLDLTTYSLTVLDYKTGSREPESTFQLGEYGHALLMAMGIAAEPADRPILGRYWLARKGIYTDAVPVVTRHPLAELQYRYDAAARGTQARIFAPHVTNLCKSCSVVDYCPAQTGRS